MVLCLSKDKTLRLLMLFYIVPTSTWAFLYQSKTSGVHECTWSGLFIQRLATHY